MSHRLTWFHLSDVTPEIYFSDRIIYLITFYMQSSHGSAISFKKCGHVDVETRTITTNILFIFYRELGDMVTADYKVGSVRNTRC